MLKVINAYKYFRWLSLDIVLGAIFFLSFLERVYRVHFLFSVYFALASAIWLIYTCDHLLDAKKVRCPSSERHRFHKEHFNTITLAGGFILILALLNLYNLPEAVIRSGALLSACCIGYLMLVYFLNKLWIKELLVAVVYAMGVFLAPLTAKGNLQGMDLALVFQLALIAFLNLLIFSHYDAENDKRDGFSSMALRFGLRKSSKIIHLSALISIAGAFGIFVFEGSAIQLLYLAMGFILYSLHVFPGFYAINGRFRTIGDGVFYLPAVFLLQYL